MIPQNAHISSNRDAGTISVVLDNSEALQRYFRAFVQFNHPEALKRVGQIAADTFNQYVPKKTGALRKSCRVIVSEDTVSLSWGEGLPYAHYQYEGIVYNYNHIWFKNGLAKGWYSSPAPKTPDPERTLGHRRAIFSRGESALMVKYVDDKGNAYSTPRTVRDPNVKNPRRYLVTTPGRHTAGTTSHWIEAVINDKRIYNPMKRDMTNVLYRTLVRSFGGTPVGLHK